jgi:hypothetical protein
MFRPARARQLKEFMEYYGIDYSGGGNWERGVEQMLDVGF